MEIDIEKLKTGGQQYIDTVVDTLLEEAWEKVCKTKFTDSSEEELTIMKNIWAHGFMCGAEAATQLNLSIYNKLHNSET